MADNPKSRGSNFTCAELNQLCASWMHVSQDPIVGSAQKIGAFWDRTVKHYNDNKPKEREMRNVRSLESKWSDLKRDVARYAGCYSNVVDAHHSGENEEDTVKRAKELYVTKDPKAKEFQYVEQWAFLKDCPRFALCMDDMKQKAAQKSGRKQKGRSAFSERENERGNVDAAVIDLEQEPENGDGPRQSFVHSSDVDYGSSHGGEQRPIGNKVAKRARHEENAVRIMACAHRQMAENSAKRLKIIEEEGREHLFTLKVAELDPECQEYFRVRRAKLLRIAMSKLQREEEVEDLSVRTNSVSKGPSPQSEQEMSPPNNGVGRTDHVGQGLEEFTNLHARNASDIGPDVSFTAQLAELDRELAD